MKVIWLGWEEMYTTCRVRQAAAALDLGLDVYNIHDISFSVDNGRSIVWGNQLDLVENYDGLMVRTFYPYISEALTLARLFHDAGKIVIDQSLTDEGYAVSKMHDYLLMVANGIPCPRTWQLFNPHQVETLAHQVSFPCVLKGVHGARGENVYLVNNIEQLQRRMWHYPHGELMLQEYIPAEEDFRVIVIGYQSLPIMISRKPPDGDFRTNYSLGGRFFGHDLEKYPGFKEISEKAARALRREFTAVDIRMHGDQPIVLEVNRQPDFEGFEKATKFDVASEVVHYIMGRIAGRSVTDPT